MNTDILISGGGVAGLAAAASFGSAGFSVICVDPHAPVTRRDAAGSDQRTTALLQPARDVLTASGIWTLIEPHGRPLEIMRIVDAGGATSSPRVTQDFKASDVSNAPFGWNFPNWLLRREMLARLAVLETVQFLPGVASTGLFTRLNEARVTLSNGAKVHAKLVVAADGRDSPIRKAAGIEVRTHRFGQKALAFAVTHPIPHENVSTEIHASGGPFTLVPLPDHDGLPSSAVVWMEDAAKVVELSKMGETEFENAMTDRSCGLLGPLTLASRRSVWPIISQKAVRLSGERVALMAEAAHVVPPIGAQGLNMSLRDVSCLLDLATSNPDRLGDRRMLDAYHRIRHRDITMRVSGIEMLNRASQVAEPPLQDIRALGLQTLHAIPPVRHFLMKMGLGSR